MSKKIKEKDVEKIKERCLFLIDGIEEDLNSIVNISIQKKKDKKNDKKSVMAEIFKEFPLLSNSDDNDLENLILSRKDRKYAALTIELASTMESFLRDLYKTVEGKEFKKSENDEISLNHKNHKKQKKVSTIQILEKKLEDKITIRKKGSLYLLNKVRNEVIHGEFSLKKVKEDSLKKLGKKEKVKSKDYISKLIASSRDYIENVTVSKES